MKNMVIIYRDGIGNYRVTKLSREGKKLIGSKDSFGDRYWQKWSGKKSLTQVIKMVKEILR